MASRLYLILLQNKPDLSKRSIIKIVGFCALKSDSGNVEEKKVLNGRGISRAVVLLAVVALALAVAIAVPVVKSRQEKMNRSLDDLYVKAAEDDAYLRWVQGSGPFKALYDSENKRFEDIRSGMPEVPPYGTAEEHEGMVLYVSVDEDGNIFTQWIDQTEDNAYR